MRPPLHSIFIAVDPVAGLVAIALALAISVAVPLPVRAATDAPTLETWVRDGVTAPSGQPLRIEVTVGSLGRQTLAPCAKAEPFVPNGVRLWGRTNIGVRCIDGARWTAYLPVRVAAWGPGYVARQSHTVGQRFEPADYTVAEVDWAERASPPVSDPAAYQGREYARPVPAGGTLRVEDLRIAPTVRAGDPVTVRVQGDGFAVAAEATALNAAADGQFVRVRTAAGRVLNGRLDGRTVTVTR